MTLTELLRDRRACCPDDTDEARVHHERVKADAATGAPTTAHGQHLLATLRPWPELGQLGECACGSSLLITEEEAVMVAATNARAEARAEVL